MMERLLQKEFWLKAFSVALAILLWAMVMQDYSAENSRTFEVPLDVKLHPTLEVEEGPIRSKEQTVEVKVVGKNLVITRLREADFRAEVDYSKYREPGRTYQVEVRVTYKDKPPANFQYHVSPKVISATLVENQEAQVRLSVEPKTGLVTYQGADYRFTASTPTPRALVTGRSDYLNKVTEALVRLEPETDLVPTKQVVSKRVIPLDSARTPVEKLKVTFVDVRLDWERLPPGKTVLVKPVVRGSPPEGFEVLGVEVSPPTVTLRATKVDGAIPGVDEVSTAAIDVSRQTRTFTVPVKLMVPDGASVATESVTATVNIGESILERTFKGVPLVVTGKASNVDVSLSVTDVQVRFRGPYSTIKTMEPESLTAYVDVENLRAGKHLLPVRVNRPQGVTEEILDPPTVEVDIVIR